MLESLSVGPLGENAYVFASEGSCVLVDPGDEGAKIVALLDRLGLVPGLIIATHGHLDHTAAIPEVLAAFRSRGASPKLAIHEADARYLGAAGEDSNRRLFASIGAPGFFRGKWRPLPEADLLLADGDEIPGVSLTVIHSPGHSPGSICLYGEEEGILLAGDTLFRDGYGRTDCFDSDPEALVLSLRRLFSLPPATRVYPGHGEATTIGREAGLN